MNHDDPAEFGPLLPHRFGQGLQPRDHVFLIRLVLEQRHPGAVTGVIPSGAGEDHGGTTTGHHDPLPRFGHGKLAGRQTQPVVPVFWRYR